MTLRDRFGTDVLLVGWAHSRFGKLTDVSLEDLIVSVSASAISNAGLEPGQIDAIYVSQFNSGLDPLTFMSSLTLQVDDSLFGTPATHVENACASGSAALQQGACALLAGTARTVLVVGAEKMTQATPAAVGSALLGADYELAGQQSNTGFAGLFARVALAYNERYGDCADTLGLIAAKNHRNGVLNPLAQIRKDLGKRFCQTVSESNPLVAAPLRRTDCAPISDGAAALILSTIATAGAATSPVRLTGFAHANDFLPRGKRDPLAFAATEIAWSCAMDMADSTLSDLSFIELHDCFTIAELNLYEVLGLTPRGQGATALLDGTVYPDGQLPVNLSGGLKAKGHPVGATGVSQHVLAAMQLSGTANEMQVANPRRAAVHNMGGLAVANYVSILEPV